ncbi:MAG: hypothetical protein RLZ12_1003, partial [Bacillota bacterium]
MKFLRKKNLATINSNGALNKNLTFLDLVLLGMGSMIGVGVFSLTGKAAVIAGPSLVFSFLLVGLAVFFAALPYAEFSSFVSSAGSVYTYTYVTIGEIYAWLIGWVLLLNYLAQAAAVAAVWSSAFVGVLGRLGWQIPVLFSTNMWEPSVSGFVNLPAVFIVLVITVLLARGVREAKWVSGPLVALKVLLLLVLIFYGKNYVHQINWQPFFATGFKGVIMAA